MIDHPNPAAPERRTRALAILGAFFVLAVLLQVLVQDYRISLYDEGLTLYGAVRVFHGQLPYRDFWTMYGPGEFYTLALAFRLFGVYALWERVFFVLTNAVSAVTILYLLHQLTRRRWLSGCIAGAILLWMNARASYGFPIYPALSLILLAMAFMLVRWRDDKPPFAIYAGAALGVAALFRHDLALYGLLALAVAAAVHQARLPDVPGRGRLWADPARLSLTALAVTAPVIVLLLARIPPHDLYYSLFYVPAQVYPKVRSLPFPNLGQVLHGFAHLRYVTDEDLGSPEYNIVWLPPLAALTCLPWVLSQLRRRSAETWIATCHLVLLLLTVLLFVKGWVRVSPLHMAPAVVPAIMLLGCLLARLRDSGTGLRIAAAFTGLWMVLCVIAALHRDFRIFGDNRRALHTSDPTRSFAAACHPEPGLQRARCLFLAPDERRSVLFVQSRTRPDDHIFVGSDRHDKLFDNDIAFYFLAARESATRWHDLHPGVETTAPIQWEMVKDLTGNRAVYVVIEYLGMPIEPNASHISSGVTLLDDYIHDNYRLQSRFGPIAVLQRSTPFAAPASP